MNEQTRYGKTYRTVVARRNVTELILTEIPRENMHIHCATTYTVVGVTEISSIGRDIVLAFVLEIRM